MITPTVGPDAAAIAAILIGLLPVGVITWRYPAWAHREITCPLPRVPLIAVTLTLFLATLTVVVAADLPFTAGAAVAAWLPVAFTAAARDWTCSRAPREPVLTLTATGITLALFTPPLVPTIDIIMTVTAVSVIPAVLWLIAPRRFGFADVTFMAATAACVAWWMPTFTAAGAVIGAAALNTIARAARRSWRVSQPFLPALAAAFTAAIAFTFTTGTTASTVASRTPLNTVKSGLDSSHLEVSIGGHHADTYRVEQTLTS